MKARKFLILILFAIVLLASPATAEQELTFATTTSTVDTGLFDVLLPPFEATYGINVEVTSVGTGKALKLGEKGEVDVVLVHSRKDEDQFVAKGFGVNRRDVMYNDFMLVGPKEDPAGVKKSRDPVRALEYIATAEAPFISRADDSGTHKREKEFWAASGTKPEGVWYIEAGQGMGAVLTMANEKRAYTLTDRGTWTAFSDTVDLAVLLEGSPKLFNPYGIIAVNPAKHAGVNYMEAMLLIAWFTSPEGQEIIRGFKKDGQAMYIPVAIPSPALSKEED